MGGGGGALLFPKSKACLGGGWLLHFQGRAGGDFVASIRGGSCRALPVENCSGEAGRNVGTVPGAGEKC